MDIFKIGAKIIGLGVTLVINEVASKYRDDIVECIEDLLDDLFCR